MEGPVIDNSAALRQIPRPSRRFSLQGNFPGVSRSETPQNQNREAVLVRARDKTMRCMVLWAHPERPWMDALLMRPGRKSGAGRGGSFSSAQGIEAVSFFAAGKKGYKRIARSPAQGPGMRPKFPGVYPAGYTRTLTKPLGFLK
jgi:hypothetical protein